MGQTQRASAGYTARRQAPHRSSKPRKGDKMKLGSRRTIVRATATAAVCLLGISMAWGQSGQPATPATEQKPVMSQDVFKNVQILRNIPVNEFMQTMGFFSASLGMNCTSCHVEASSGSWARYADDTPLKQMARRMMLMMNSINKTNFGGARMVTCYSCHHGDERPTVTPSLVALYAGPPPEVPDQVTPDPNAPPVNQIFDKYLQALGGVQKLANIKSIVGKGTYQGYGDEKHPVDVFAKAPDQRTTIVHAPLGETTTTFTGTEAWLAGPQTDRPVPVVALTGGDLAGAKLEAELTFPVNIKQTLTDWKVGYSESIDDRDMQVVQGMSSARLPIKLYFDKETGLLTREVHVDNSPVGFVPTQVDYSDYRDVSGVKMPFKWTTTWLDGRSYTELSQIQANVPIDAKTFTKPSAPPAPPAPKVADH